MSAPARDARTPRREVPRGGRGALRPLLLLLLLPALLFLPDGGTFLPLRLLGPSPAEAEERILLFDGRVRIEPDGSLTVTETIRVRAEGNQIRRGIYRDFPTTYKTPEGRTVRVPFDPVEVLRDGRPEPWHTERVSNGVRLYAGDKDTLIPPGVHTYVLTYRTDRQIGFFEDHDELYWNATGNGWAFPIDRARELILLPEAPSGDPSLRRFTRWTAYTGPQGARGKAWRAENRGASILFETTAPLGAGEGLTVVAAWPKGLIPPPGEAEKAGLFLQEHAGEAVLLLGFLFVLGYYLYAWFKVGRDPEAGPIIPRFFPPEGVSPADARVLSRMGYDDKALAAALIDCAVRGAARIAVEGSTYAVTRNAEDPARPLFPEERTLLSRLVSAGETLELKQRHHSRISSAREAFRKTLESRLEGKDFNAHRLWFYLGVGLTVGVLFLAGLAMLTFGTGDPTVLFLMVWLGFWTLGVWFLGRRILLSWRAVRHSPGGRILSTLKALAVTLFALPFFLGELGGLFVLFSLGEGILTPLLVLALALTNPIFSRLLKAPTLEGRRLMDELEGFRMYLSVAEADRLNLLNPPERTPELFERFLPYALALDVEQAWSESFADVLARARDAEGNPYRPVWWVGGAYHAFHPEAFASSLGDSLATTIASSATAPGSSSGFGGGGSSGGGGGGGGGGGW